MIESTDALVIGGGPAGATAALLLARAGWSVVLLESKTFPRRKVCGEYLSATSLPLLGRLGVGEAFREAAGPDVRRVGLYAGTTTLSAALPRVAGPVISWGRALARQHLDTLLLAQAAAAGADVRQPWKARTLTEEGGHYLCEAESHADRATCVLRSPVVIAAHGSWEPGALRTQPVRMHPGPRDLLSFKAHFHSSDLPVDLMPLLAFPGGYGGMVHCDGGRVSLSCCIRRDRLQELRLTSAGEAGDVVLGHILESCRGVRQALAGAVREGSWLAAGPIRPGIRVRAEHGLFRAGNCAGEAHPVIAEGISMAMQSAWLLAERLIRWRQDGGAIAALHLVGKDYARAWRRSFAPRLYAAAGVAHWAMHSTLVAHSLPVLRWAPPLLTLGARLSGKATLVVGV